MYRDNVTNLIVDMDAISLFAKRDSDEVLLIGKEFIELGCIKGVFDTNTIERLGISIFRDVKETLSYREMVDDIIYSMPETIIEKFIVDNLSTTVKIKNGISHILGVWLDSEYVLHHVDKNLLYMLYTKINRGL